VREVPGSNPGFPLLLPQFFITNATGNEQGSQTGVLVAPRTAQSHTTAHSTGRVRSSVPCAVVWATRVAVVDKRDEHIGADLVR
jgi:hypothetical protein